MLDGLCRRDQRRIEHHLVVDLARDLVRLVDNAVDRRAFGPLRLDLQFLERLVEPFDLPLRLPEMGLEPLFEFGIGRFRDHIRKGFFDLMFGVIDVLHGVQEEIPHCLHVCGKPTHGAPP